MFSICRSNSVPVEEQTIHVQFSMNIESKDTSQYGENAFQPTLKMTASRVKRSFSQIELPYMKNEEWVRKEATLSALKMEGQVPMELRLKSFDKRKPVVHKFNLDLANGFDKPELIIKMTYKEKWSVDTEFKESTFLTNTNRKITTL